MVLLRGFCKKTRKKQISNLLRRNGSILIICSAAETEGVTSDNAGGTLEEGLAGSGQDAIAPEAGAKAKGGRKGSTSKKGAKSVKAREETATDGQSSGDDQTDDDSSWQEVREYVKGLILRQNAGSFLTQEEKKYLQKIPRSEIYNLTNSPVDGATLSTFTVEQDSMVHLIFVLKDTSRKILSKNKNLKTQEINELNSETGTINLLYVITENNKQCFRQDVLNFFNENFFKPFIVPLIPKNVVLETVQLKQVDPVPDKPVVISSGFTTVGALDPRNHKASHRAFVFNLYSPTVTGGRNDFTVRIPFVSSSLGDWENYPSSTIINSIKGIQTFLKNPVNVGDGLSFGLMLETTQTAAFFRYNPVTDVTITGFNSAIKTAKPKETVQLFLKPSGNLSNESAPSDGDGEDDNGPSKVGPISK